MQRLCSATLLCVIALAATASGAVVKGTVSEFGTGNRLPNMVVAAYTVAGVQQALATTDSNGNYSVTLAPGLYRLLAYDNALVYATAYAGDADSFETSNILNLMVDTSGINFALHRAGTISGSVADSNGLPLAAMTVAAYNTPDGTRRGFTQTDAAGRYTLVVPPGTYRLAAFDNNSVYTVRFFDDQATFAAAADVTVAASQSQTAVNFRLSLAAHVNGRVVDSDTNLPLPGKLVIAYGPDASQIATTTTDFGGNFALTVAAADYKFVAVDTTRLYAAGYLSDANSFANEPIVSPSAGLTTEGVQIPMHRAGVISGAVRDASGAPLPSITVAAYNDDGTQRTTAQTDAGGAYALLIPPGKFRIAAYDTSLTYATAFYPDHTLFLDARSISVIAGATSGGVDLRLVRGGQIGGAATDKKSGAPLAAIMVAAYDENANVISSAVSSSSGQYALVVPPGSYRFAAFDNQLRYITAYSGGAPNFDTASWMTVAGASTNQLNFALTQGVRLAGNVVDSSAAFVRVSDLQVGALDLSGDRVATATATDGTFNLVVPPGTYKLLVTDPLNRFYTTFYNNAFTLDKATPVVVNSSGPAAPVTILLIRETRRRAAPH